jgi:hypothetical protein
MNFVDLVEKLRIECGVSGSPVLSVQNLSGELLRLKNWIADAWDELQAAHQDWKFLHQTFSFSTTANKRQYTYIDAGIASFDIWDQSSFWIYNVSFGVSDQQPIGQMPWHNFREMYIRGVQTPMRPMCYSVAPDKSLWFGPLPDIPYNITGEYWVLPSAMVNDTDTPAGLPLRFHRCIVYGAMKKYAGYEGAAEVMARAQSEGTPLWNNLELDQLPIITIAGGGFNVA